uniref:Organic solute carrier partner 1 n=1 Tax=Scleropages formosus TaxID=113540 RepID=A0A8C9S8W4_SCLFO
MSMRTLPLLFINLGGEMLYILDQRLQAQNVPTEKTSKVMNDIICTLFSKPFMEELFKPQDMYSKRTQRAVLIRLAHSSIMRLNQASMDKLYDLMTMAFKYQVLLCPRPRDLLLVTFNHMDAIRAFVSDTPAILNQVEETYQQLIKVYTPLSDGEFQLLRQTLLMCFQDLQIRVSAFLKDKVQTCSGRFVLPLGGPVPCGSEVPGLIRLFVRCPGEACRGQEVCHLFPSGGAYCGALPEGSFHMSGDRVITLGTNMYSESRPVQTQVSESQNFGQHTKMSIAPNLLAKEELTLLSHLLGSLENQDPDKTRTFYRVNLFTVDMEEEYGNCVELSFQVLNIQAAKDQQAEEELARIVGEFTEKGEPSSSPRSKGDDLLTLMDELQ